MFEDKVFNEISFNRNEKPVNENFYGDKTYKFPISIEDSIVKYNRLYSKTYLVNGLKYDFNYYINDGKFICEIVKFI